MKIDQVQFLTAEIINILEHMHSKGISHRDLKPSNLLLDEEYHLKLIDFGTAKIKDKDSPKKSLELKQELPLNDDDDFINKGR
jgi:3-phosphoinositide dependent protein kinase-1